VATVTIVRDVPTDQETAFDAIADFTSSASWDPGIASARRLDDGPVGLGSRFEVQYRFGPVTAPLVYEITRFERPGRVVLTTRSLLHRGEDDVRIRGTATETHLTWQARFGFRGPGLLMEPLLRVGFPRVAAEAGDGLAAYLASLARHADPTGRADHAGHAGGQPT
jgi:dehydrogenase/reductase SDR family member 12